jgi:hypothetical protein
MAIFAIAALKGRIMARPAKPTIPILTPMGTPIAMRINNTAKPKPPMTSELMAQSSSIL